MARSQSARSPGLTRSAPSADSNRQTPSFHGQSGSEMRALKRPGAVAMPPIRATSSTRPMGARMSDSVFTCMSASHVSGCSAGDSHSSTRSAWSTWRAIHCSSR